MFRKLVGYATSFSLVATSVMATSGKVTANLNFRTEPGTGSPVILTIPDGSAVEILDCNEAGSWCALEFQGQTGFSSGRYVIETEPRSDTAFPRSFGLEGDAFVVLYEPQFSAWTDFQELHALVAAEFRSNEEAEPVFGVIGLGADTTSVSDDRTVVASNMRVTQLDFAALDRDQLAPLSVGVGGLLPTDPITLAEERILAGLSNYQSVADVDGMKAEPPVILVSHAPSRLVQTDGPAIFATVENSPDVEFVVNTNWDLLRVDDVLWLRDQTAWLSAAAIEGPWTVVDALPEKLRNLPDNGNWEAALAAQPPARYDDGAPDFFYSDEPAEMIVFDGPTLFERVPGTDLRWASNTESDLFQQLSTGTYYYLVSGRWFSSASLDGPWKFATPDLPPDFQRIPDDTPYYTVRASIPGTSEAKEARLRASIPELAQVTLSEFDSPSIAYDGDPTFEPIAGTEVAYATNTAAQVIQVAERYYVVVDGIWFVSDSPDGPWAPAAQVPDEIYEIPPSSPMHNTTYVRVYETTPTTVTYGYTPGYFGSFLAWGAVIYGTGWWDNDWWDNDGYYPPGYYRPPPVTYGGGAYYNPARGAYGRYGYANGPYRGVEARAAYNPSTGTFARGRQVYGPEGSGGFVHASNPRTGTTAVARGGESAYANWGSAAVKRGSDYARVRARESAAGGKGVKWDSSRGSGFAVSGRRGNTYAGRDGNVFRQSGDSWQKWDPDSGWEDVQFPTRDQLRQQSEPLQAREATQQRLREPENRPQAGQRQGAGQRQNAGSRVPNQVQRDAQARGRANQLSHQSRQQYSPATSRRTTDAMNQRYGSTPSRATAQRAPTRATPNRTPTRSAPQRSYSSHRSTGARSQRGGGRSRGGGRR